LTKC